MTAALDHYRDQIQQALKHAPMSQLPEPLATIAYLLACGNEANAAGLAEYLTTMMPAELAYRTCYEVEQVCRYVGDTQGALAAEACINNLRDAAALREGAG